MNTFAVICRPYQLIGPRAPPGSPGSPQYIKAESLLLLAPACALGHFDCILDDEVEAGQVVVSHWDYVDLNAVLVVDMTVQRVHVAMRIVDAE
jgi:hypothetical protein